MRRSHLVFVFFRAFRSFDPTCTKDLPTICFNNYDNNHDGSQYFFFMIFYWLGFSLNSLYIRAWSLFIILLVFQIGRDAFCSILIVFFPTSEHNIFSRFICWFSIEMVFFYRNEMKWNWFGFEMCIRQIVILHCQCQCQCQGNCLI